MMWNGHKRNFGVFRERVHYREAPSGGCKCRPPPLLPTLSPAGGGEVTALSKIPELDMRGHFEAGGKGKGG